MTTKELNILLSIQEDLQRLQETNIKGLINHRQSDLKQQIRICLLMVSNWIHNEKEMIEMFGSDE